MIISGDPIAFPYQRRPVLGPRVEQFRTADGDTIPIGSAILRPVAIGGWRWRRQPRCCYRPRRASPPPPRFQSTAPVGSGWSCSTPTGRHSPGDLSLTAVAGGSHDLNLGVVLGQANSRRLNPCGRQTAPDDGQAEAVNVRASCSVRAVPAGRSVREQCWISRRFSGRAPTEGWWWHDGKPNDKLPENPAHAYITLVVRLAILWIMKGLRESQGSNCHENRGSFWTDAIF